MTVRQRTEEDILAYLRLHHVQGKLTKSLLEIADEVGYSNATVHRVLKRLETQHLVFVERNQRRANEPSTIYYLGPNEDDKLLEEGVELVNRLKSAADELLAFFQRSDRSLRILQEDALKWQQIKDRLIDVTDLPQGLQLMTIRHDPARHLM